MIRRWNICLLIAVATLTCLSWCKAQPARVSASLDASQAETIIAPEIYGQFAEHLGGCIYGGLWVGEQSEIPHVNGYRKDVLEALKKLQVPVLRWPGGCFADDYHWRDGVGAREDRPTTLNIYWGGVEDDNSFGTHEFLGLCELLNCEAYVAGNVGSGTVEEMREWVEYMTSDSNSSLANLRRQHGRQQPWRVRYFGVGNENWGCGGNMSAQFYSDLYRRYATYVRDFSGNRVLKIASGPSGRDVPWMDTLIRNVFDQADAVSMHYYVLPTEDWDRKGPATGFSEADWFSVIRQSFAVEALIKDYEQILDEVDPERRVALYVDEWGTWYDKADDRASALYQQNTLRDAVSAAIFLNIFHDHADRIRMANIAQVVNVLQAMILTNEDSMVLTPTYHVFEMYRVHQGAKHIPIEYASPSYALEGKQVPSLSLTASVSNGELNVSVVNSNPQQDLELELEVAGFQAAAASGRVLTAGSMDALNDFQNAERVCPAAIQNVSLQGNSLRLTVPAKSVSVVTLRP